MGGGARDLAGRRGRRSRGQGGRLVSAPAIQVERLMFAYPDGRQALFGVDFTIERGERVAWLGRSGAGKTALVLHLNGILGSVAGGTGSGRLQIGGARLRRQHPPPRAPRAPSRAAPA